MTTTLTRPGARELVTSCTDAGSWCSWDEPIDPSAYSAAAQAFPGYLESLEHARDRAGTDEAVITGQARIRGHEVALVVGEFAFMGGSVGTVTGDRITGAVRRATREGLPIIAATASGGTRMQEGTPAFVKMLDISRAVVAHREAGLPYLVYLRHPTTGGVFASWGSLGQLSVAEPGALIGFLGPVVYEALHGTPFPAGVQTAENLVAKGILDAAAPLAGLPDIAGRILGLLAAPDAVRPSRRPGPDIHAGSRPTTPAATVGRPRPDAWEAVALTRRHDRPGIRELLRFSAEDVIPLSGTQAGEAAPAVLSALASFDGQRCVVIGQDRRTQLAGQTLGPAALRAARRAMRLADELRLPLVSVIDTPGAELSAAAEEGALAPEIARCLADLIAVRVPTVSVLLGQGCGGGALALLPAARVVAAEYSWLAPLPPEGASAILTGNADHAAELARTQRIGSHDLLTHRIVDVVVPEQPAAHVDPRTFSCAIAAAIVDALRAQLR